MMVFGHVHIPELVLKVDTQVALSIGVLVQAAMPVFVVLGHGA